MNPIASGSKNTDEVLSLRDLRVHFPVYRGVMIKRRIGTVRAVDGVSFSLSQGLTLGLVGESGCGKTTIGRTIVRLNSPTSGSIYVHGKCVTSANRKELLPLRKKIQMIFQDPYSSLNPRMKIHTALDEVLAVHKPHSTKKQRSDRMIELMECVGLSADHLSRYPHEFSGGQRQRICIARSLATDPEIVICDEAVSALDVSIQSQILNMLKRLKEQMNLCLLFISHDLAAVRYISDSVCVMYLGKIVERAQRSDLYNNPLHPYTIALLSAVPVADPEAQHKRERILLSGEIPSPLAPPAGCHFNPRCPWATDVCKEEYPEETLVVESDGTEHRVACHNWRDIDPARKRRMM